MLNVLITRLGCRRKTSRRKACRSSMACGLRFPRAKFVSDAQISGGALECEGSTNMRVWPGRPYPLGATFDGSGVNFALFSEHAEKVELCLFNGPDDTAEA